MPYRVLAVAISGKLGYTFGWSLFGGRYFICGLVCMGNRAWVRGSDTDRIYQTGRNFFLDLVSVFTT